MSLYKRPGSSLWWTKFTVNGERLYFSTGETDRAAAQRVENRLKAAQDDKPKLKGKTWGGAVLKWAQAQERGSPDLQSLAKFGGYYKDRALSAVTADNLDEALRKFVKTDGTYNRYANRLHAVLALSGVNIKLHRRDNKAAKVRDWITQEQFAKLLAELPAHQKAMVSFAAMTGLRQANVLQLTWKQIAWEHSMVWIEARHMKAKKAVGIPLSTDALQLLEEQRALNAHPEFVFTYHGEPISEIKTAFQAACVRAGLGRVAVDVSKLPVSRRYEGFTWHGLRHSWATWHAQNGTPLEVLKELGAWADMKMLTERYAHHVPGIKASYAGNFKEKTK